jgi:1,4-alpha-glucan branching enzyme
VPRPAYRVGVPFAGRWSELINSDAGIYAGSNYGNDGGAQTEEEGSHGQPLSLVLNLPPLAVLMLRPLG